MAIPMPLTLEIIFRFSLGSGQRRFTRFVAMASLIGMMLGVAALIMVLSVMNGFSSELHQRLLSVTPDLVLEPSMPTMDELSELARRAREQPSVVAATPFQRATTLLQLSKSSLAVTRFSTSMCQRLGKSQFAQLMSAASPAETPFS